ncbi:homoserine kinase [Sciscionella sediminilitoris]|uniref:homoserine kinase n=1 Tax=Sciscionella sediminilitoris TaxID=1445613 RepID=UPI0004DF92DD|nr:homoserine kinase [Sciscionella sp. SE31]
MKQRVRIRVPGSSANLGPGFDALGLALGIHDTLEVSRADRLEVTVSGEAAQEVPRDEGHLVLRAMRAAEDRLGVRIGPVKLSCANEIPHARGLGSSAAAIVAGIAAVYGLLDRELDGQALQLAAEFERHADNVAASLFGGLQLTWERDGQYRGVGFATHPKVCPIALVPELQSSTHATRGLLPETVPHADAAFAAGHTALVVHALTSDPELLLEATADRLHQEYRKSAWPSSLDLLHDLREQGIAATISGAGPTVLAFGEPPAGLVPEGFRAVPLAVDEHGVRVESE